MSALRFWVIAGALCIALPILGLPPVVVVLIASPFAILAGWNLIDQPSRHICGWCGRRFSGPYEWCCTACEGDAS